MYERPYWYSLGNRQLDDSGYFGRWCVEAVAAVKAFGLDDRLCLGHEHYPGDLLRPDGPSTHAYREISVPSHGGQTARPVAKVGMLARCFNKSQTMSFSAMYRGLMNWIKRSI